MLSPPLIGSGDCFYCKRTRTSRCEQSKLLGSAVLDGTQAEYVRIPLGESSLFHAPNNIPHEALILMADIFPTGYFVCRQAHDQMNAEERKGTTAVVIGCGPVGLCAVTAATHFFDNVYAIDSVPERLEAAKKHGAKEAWNFKDSSVDIAARVKELTQNRGADVVLEVVGHLSALEMGVQIVRPWGIISSVGIHTHEVKLKGLDLYNKNIRFHFGRCPVRALFKDALDVLAQHGDLFKDFVQNEVPIDEAEKWYELFEVSRRDAMARMDGVEADNCVYLRGSTFWRLQQNKCLKTAFKMGS